MQETHHTGRGLGLPGSWFAQIRRVLFVFFALCGLFAFLGCCIAVVFLLLPHFLAPPTANQAKDLYFDYSLPAAVAEVSLLPDELQVTKVNL